MPTTPLHLLLVEAEASTSGSLREELASALDGALELSVVSRLDAAIDTIGGGEVDVVLLDLDLPDSTGMATLATLLTAHPSMAVVVVNGDDDDLALRVVEAGAQDYLVRRAMRPAGLLRVARHAAARARLQRSTARLAARQRMLGELGARVATDEPIEDRLADAAAMLGTVTEAGFALVLQRRMDGRYLITSARGAPDLEGVRLPALLAAQLSGPVAEPLVVCDTTNLEAPAWAGVPAPIRSCDSFVVLPLEGELWHGAIALIDTPCDEHDDGVEEFLRAAGTMLVTAIRRSEAEFDRNERIKELAALAAIGRIVQETDDVDEVLRAVAIHLASGMHDPGRAVVRIQLDDLTYVADGGDPALVEELAAPITCDGVWRGEVAVGHRTSMGFLEPYEQQLVDATAEIVSLWLETHERMGQVRASATRLRSVLAQVPGMVWMVDRDMVVLGHAGRAHDDLSWEPDERRGRRLADVVGKASPAIGAVRTALAGDAAFYEVEIEGRAFETRVEPMCDEDGEVVGAIAMSVDVTDQRLATAELDASRRRLEGVFAVAHDGFLLADDHGRLVDANEAAATLLGVPTAGLVELCITDLAPDSTDERIAAVLRELRDGGRIEGIWQIQRSDGTAVVAQYRAVGDVVPGVHLVVLTDVTEATEAMAALRQSEERFRRLAENARDVIYRLDLAGPMGFEYVSPAVEDLVGVTAADLYDDPQQVIDMLTREDAVRLLRCVAGPRENPAPFVAEITLPDGRTRWVEERHGYVFDDDGRHVATEGLVRDITERKLREQDLRQDLEEEQVVAQQLRELNEMKDVFLAAVSHELRTPLTSLKGVAQLLQSRHRTLDEPTLLRLLDRMVANADRLERLLDDLLDLDRLSRDAELLTLRDVDVADVVARTLEHITENGHPITTSLMPVHATIDEAKVERIVENLVVNALRHTDPGVDIWISLDEEDDHVLLRVEDAGPGIPQHLRERVLEPFGIGDSPAARVEGLGIGLSLVARFAELHGGEVVVGDRAGGGAAFHVRLPRHAQN